jgi:FOG: HEAT repeat
MQSVAAIYGIFIAIFLLTIQRSNVKISSVATVLKPLFETVSYIIITVLWCNGLILFSLSYYNLEESKVNNLLIFSLISLFVSLFAIIYFSFIILSNPAGLKTPEEFLIQIEKDEDKLKLYSKTSKQIEGVVLSLIKQKDDDTDKLNSYMNSDAYKTVELIESYIEMFKTHENPFIRARIAKLFGNIKIQQAVELLIEKLDDYYAIVRQYSAEALGEINDSRAVEPLIKALETDGDADVRESSAKALGKIKDVRAIESPDSSKSANASILIDKINNSQVVEALIQALDDSHAGVRQSAALVLGKINDVRAVEPLIEKLKDNSTIVRNASIDALGKINDVRAVEPLIEKLKDKDSFIRMSAALALGKIKDIRAVEPLIEKLNDDDRLLRHDSAYALGEIKDVRAVEPLIQAMNSDKEVNVRVAAAIALCKINDLRAVDSFIRNLNNNDIIFYSATALGKIKDKRAIGPLIKKLNGNDYDFAKSDQARYMQGRSNFNDIRKLINRNTKCNLINALGELGDVSAVEPLIRCLNDNDGDVVSDVALALGKIKDKRATKPLIKKLNYNTYNFTKSHLENCSKKYGISIPKCKNLFIKNVKLELINALDELGDKRAVESLIRCLNDNDGDIVLNLALALGKIRDKRATKPLIKKLYYNDYDFDIRDLIEYSKTNGISIPECQKLFNRYVRSQLALVLGVIGDEGSFNALIKILNDDDDDDVRRASGEALIRIKGKKWFRLFLSERPDLIYLWIDRNQALVPN